MRVLYVGFKGINNASYQLVSQFNGEKLFLTNSFPGLTRDIEKLTDVYSSVYLFGIDKMLTDTVRIESCAEHCGKRLFSALPLEEITAALHAHGIKSILSSKPTHYLCNDAYFKLLERNNCKVVLIHIPSIRNTNHTLFNGIINSVEKRNT